MYSQGPVATVHYNSRGFAVASPDAMIAGFVHMLVVTVLMALGLYRLSRSVTVFADQLWLLGLGVVGATIFIRLGQPIWYHQDWPYAIYSFIADTISLGVAGDTPATPLAQPIGSHQYWLYAIYSSIADTISLGVAGLIILRLLPRGSAPAAAEPAAAPAGSTSDL